MKTPVAVRRARFFRTVWRINGLFLLAIGAAAAIGAVVGVVALIWSLVTSYAPRRTGQVVAAVSGRDPKDRKSDAPLKLQLRQAEPVRGTSWRMMAQAEAVKRGGGRFKTSYEGYYGGAVRNYLFLNTEDLSRHYLLPNAEAVIVETKRLGEETASGKNPVRWIEYHVVRTDANDDEHLDEEDRFDVAYSDAAGKNFTVLIPGVDEVLGTEMRGPDTRLVIYNKQGGTFTTLLDLKTRRAVRQETLATPDSQD